MSIDLSEEMTVTSTRRFLQDKTYIKEKIARFGRPELPGPQIEYKNIIFKNCHMEHGAHIGRSGFIFENILFDNTRCNHFDAPAGNIFRNVKFTGKAQPKLLKIITGGQPENVTGLDIYDYKGDLWIEDIDPSCVRINPKEHFIAYRDRLIDVDFNELGLLDPFDWKFFVWHFKRRPLQNGIQMIPDLKDYPPEMRYHDFDIIQGLGLID